MSVLTYRAASGALAVLSSSEKVCNQIIKVLFSYETLYYSLHTSSSPPQSVRVRSLPLFIITRDTGPRAAMRPEVLVTRMAFTRHPQARKIVNYDGEEGCIIIAYSITRSSVPKEKKKLKTCIEFNCITGGRNIALHGERMVAGCFGI